MKAPFTLLQAEQTKISHLLLSVLPSGPFITLVELCWTHSDSLMLLLYWGAPSCTEYPAAVQSRMGQFPPLTSWWCCACCTSGPFWLTGTVDSYLCHQPKAPDPLLWDYSPACPSQACTYNQVCSIPGDVCMGVHVPWSAWLSWHKCYKLNLNHWC